MPAGPRPHDLLAMGAPPFEALRYMAAAGVIAVGCACVLAFLDGPRRDEATAEVDSAVMIDLPATAASARAESEAQDGPEQQAQAASPAAPDVPKPPDEKAAEDKPLELAPPTGPIALPPAPSTAPEPAPIEPAPDTPAQASPQVATAEQVEMAPSGAQSPDPEAVDEGEDGQPRPSTQAITSWQRSLMKRLEDARRQFAAARHGSGTVTVAFSIDVHGALVSRHVEKSSGQPALDAAGLQLVQRAAPFPTPPAGSRNGDLSFVIPIRFR